MCSERNWSCCNHSLQCRPKQLICSDASLSICLLSPVPPNDPPAYLEGHGHMHRLHPHLQHQNSHHLCSSFHCSSCAQTELEMATQKAQLPISITIYRQNNLKHPVIHYSYFTPNAPKTQKKNVITIASLNLDRKNLLQTSEIYIKIYKFKNSKIQKN